MDRPTQSLLSLGYVADHMAWKHPEGPIAAFLGDIIDMGRANRAVVNLVRAMCDQGCWVAIMGNHELNALLFWNIKRCPCGSTMEAGGSVMGPIRA